MRRWQDLSKDEKESRCLKIIATVVYMLILMFGGGCCDIYLAPLMKR